MYRDRSSLVDKDCLRTDRLLDFYKGENNQNIATMYDILMTYCQYNHDLGSHFRSCFYVHIHIFI